jgi:hypothetical protein
LKQKHASRDVSEFAEVISLNVQYILFILEENVLYQRSKPTGPSMASNPHRFEPSTDTPSSASPERGRRSSPAHKRQQEKSLSDYAQQDLSIVTQRITTRHAKALNKANELISLLAPTLSTIKHVISQIKLISMRRFASYSKHAKVSKQHLIINKP